MNEGSRGRVLIYGYGNPGRLDDGLGPALVKELETRGTPGIALDSNYQLSVGDAATVAENDIVIFVDADVSCEEPFWFGEVVPDPGLGFSSHNVSPQKLMDLACGLLGGATRGYILGIRGYEFNEFGEVLSPGAQKNLDAATGFIEEALRDGQFEKLAANRKTNLAQ